MKTLLIIMLSFLMASQSLAVGFSKSSMIQVPQPSQASVQMAAEQAPCHGLIEANSLSDASKALLASACCDQDCSCDLGTCAYLQHSFKVSISPQSFVHVHSAYPSIITQPLKSLYRPPIFI